jgi:hypothetical protein
MLVTLAMIAMCGRMNGIWGANTVLNMLIRDRFFDLESSITVSHSTRERQLILSEG